MMTTEDEPRFILEQILSCRDSVKEAEASLHLAQKHFNTLERNLDQCNNAMIAYMLGNNLQRLEINQRAVILSKFADDYYVDIVPQRTFTATGGIKHV